ncbi:MAG: EamA family transporter [Clostridia bacterium]|nr:EamA family transporter [Clostridia bacterium]
MQQTLFIIFVILAITVQNVIKKAYGDKTQGFGTYIFTGIVCIVAAVFFAVTKKGGLHFSMEILPYSAGFALGFAAIMVFSILAIRCGSLAITSLIISYSLMVPTVFGIIYFKEPTSWPLYVGVALLLISLALINREEGKVKVNVKWIIYAVLSFFGNGFCYVVMQLQEKSAYASQSNEFMIIALLMAATLMIVMALIYERKHAIMCLKKAYFPVICGAANGLANFLTILLLGMMPASVMNPLTAAGGIVATAAVSILLYHEKLSKYQIAGVILGTASVVFLNL